MGTNTATPLVPAQQDWKRSHLGKRLANRVEGAIIPSEWRVRAEPFGLAWRRVSSPLRAQSLNRCPTIHYRTNRMHLS